MTENLIELRHIGKRFGGVKALDDVSLSIRPGEIHCLAGENGSGKSTVIKIMSGVYTPEDGEISDRREACWQTRSGKIRSPRYSGDLSGFFAVR